jgi:hypothetical protein
MLKRICPAFLLFIFIWSPYANAQLSWDWAIDSDASGFTWHDECHSIAVDAQGNAYFGGYIQSDLVSLGGQNLINYGSSNPYLGKVDSMGNLLWLRQGRALGNNEITHLALIDGGAIGVGSMSAGNMIWGSDSLNHSQSDEIFVIRLDSIGNVVWLQLVHSSGSSNRPRSVAVDAAQNIYVTGVSYADYLLFGGDTIHNRHDLGNENAFVLKFDGQGTPLWGFMPEISGYGGILPSALKPDGHGHLYWTGLNEYDTISVQGLLAVESPGFICKLDTAGHPLWLRSVQSQGPFKSVNVQDILYDENDRLNLLVGGPDALVYDGQVFAPNATGQNMLVMQCDSSGNLIWGRMLAGNGDIRPYNLILDAENHVVVHASMVSSMRLHPPLPNAPGAHLLNAPPGAQHPSMLLKLDYSGNHCAAIAFPFGGDDIERIALGPNNHIYLGGSYGYEIDTLVLGNQSMVKTGNEDLLLGRFTWDCEPLMVRHDLPSKEAPRIFPNPFENFIRIDAVGSEVDEYQLRDALGRILSRGRIEDGHQTINAEGMAPGIYILQLLQEKELRFNLKLVHQ